MHSLSLLIRVSVLASLFSVSLSCGKNTRRSHAPIQACEPRQFFSLSGNMCHFCASLHRDDSLQRVKCLLVYYYWGFHSHKTYIQRRGCHEKNSNESPCKSDKRKYLTVKVINGAVKQRPVKYISSHFLRRISNEASDSLQFLKEWNFTQSIIDFSPSQNKTECSYSNSCYKCSVRSYKGIQKRIIHPCQAFNSRVMRAELMGEQTDLLSHI